MGVTGVRNLALDPGLSTGWAEWADGHPRGQGVITGGLSGFIDYFHAHPTWARGVDTLIIEDFIVEPDYTGIAWSSEVKGAAVALIPHRRLVVQKRFDKSTLFGQRVNGKKVTGKKGEAMRFDWLHKRGFSGSSHELDAHTHMLVYEKRQENPEILARYWNL